MRRTAYSRTQDFAEPEKWLLHCHISHHTTNNNVEVDGGGGLMLILDVAPAEDGTPAAA
jgi:hypothetical protein